MSNNNNNRTNIINTDNNGAQKRAELDTESSKNWFRKHYKLEDEAEAEEANEDDENDENENDDDDVKNTLALHYDKDFAQRKFELLEVSDDVYDELFSRKDDDDDDDDSTREIIFKGDYDEEAVLCTKEKTYQVKRVETSNTVLLLAPPEVYDRGLIERDSRGRKIAKAHAEVKSHLDLTEIAPRFRKLYDKFMSVSAFTKQSCEKASLDAEDLANGAYEFTFLLSKIQASEKELREQLWNPSSLINAVRISSSSSSSSFTHDDVELWKGIEEDAIESVLDWIVVCLAENGDDDKFDFSSKKNPELVPEDVYAVSEKKFPLEICEFALRKFSCSSSSSSSSSSNDDDFDRAVDDDDNNKKRQKMTTTTSASKRNHRYKLDFKKVVRFKLERYIKHRYEQNAKINFQEVIEKVSESIAIDEIKMDLLQALNIIITVGDEKVVEEQKRAVIKKLFAGLAIITSDNDFKRGLADALVANVMPEEPKDRFAVLWKAKPKWTLEELEPYLEGMIQTPGVTQESMLLKFCRLSSHNVVLQQQQHNNNNGDADNSVLYSKR